MSDQKEPVKHTSPRAVLELLPPFPIVLVTTRTNIITIGQIQYFTFTPLRIGIAVAHSRHTHSLLKEEREFVINIPTADQVDMVKLCGSISGKHKDKFKESGLTAGESEAVKAVRITECAAHIECIVEQELEFEKRTWFIGTVAAARKNPDHTGSHALLCGRTEYSVPGEVISGR